MRSLDLRSMLFIPAHMDRFVEKVLEMTGDKAPSAVILDLEDGVPEHLKSAARGALARQVLKLSKRYPVFVRINSLDSRHWLRDLEASAIEGVAGLVIPKVRSSGEVVTVDRVLGFFEDERGLEGGGLAIMPIIEATNAVLAAHEIALSSRRIIALGFGSGDYALDMGRFWWKDGVEYGIARSLVAMMAKAAGVLPIDGVYMDLEDLEGLKRDTMLSRRLGYEGRMVVHPSQIPVVNKYYLASDVEVELSRRIVEEYERAAREGRGAIRVDGLLVDYLHYKMAKRILEKAGLRG